ncbi:MAPEG family protein [Pyruvatibacter sp. HU-CL02332]|uniref:MAPEG family protein n=1 Tax=Pyruvatibacter sp. HU-CL02332 TaxID=3127650 RepID=UPI002967F856|nr:MAPEG family protein [Alphaproteobacteria bacterium]
MGTAVLCVVAMALLIFLLGFWVSIQRGRTDVMTGVETDPTSGLNKAVRAHGNTAEYVPVLAILILYLGTQDVAAWVGWAMIVAAVSRYLVVLGFLTCKTLEKPHVFKAVGALGTYVAGFAMCFAAYQTVA